MDFVMPDGSAPASDGLELAASALCRDRLGRAVLGCERAGAPGKPALRVFLDDGPVIAIRREHPDRARLEADVLSELSARGAPVPRILAFDGMLVVLEDLGPWRLADAFALGDEQVSAVALDTALGSLGDIQRAAREAGLADRAPTIGTRPGWLDNLLSAPSRIGERLFLPAPRLDETSLRAVLETPNSGFVKWDARPGKAALLPDGTVAWLDWRHCGRRDPVDDIAWLLSDEHTPDLPTIERELLDRHLPAITGPDYRGAPRDYLRMFGVFHMCIRLHVMLNSKADGPWPLEPGTASLEAATRTCRRAARWAAELPQTAPLEDWLLALPSVLETLTPMGESWRIHPASATVH